MMSVLIWGSLTPLSAFSSGVVPDLSMHPIISVWRFGKDSKHLTNSGEEVGLVHTEYIFMNLQRTRISPNPGKKKGIEVLHTGGQKPIPLRNFHSFLESPHKGRL